MPYDAGASTQVSTASSAGNEEYKALYPNAREKQDGVRLAARVCITYVSVFDTATTAAMVKTIQKQAPD